MLEFVFHLTRDCLPSPCDYLFDEAALDRKSSVLSSSLALWAMTDIIESGSTSSSASERRIWCVSECRLVTVIFN